MLKKLFTSSLVILLVIACFGVNVSQATWIGIDDFESYSLGALASGAGGSGWSANWSAADGVVISSPVFEGVRAVEFQGTGQAIGRNFTAITSGQIHVAMYMPTADTGDELTFLLEDKAVGTAFRVKMIGAGGSAGTISLVGATTQSICAFTAATWYEINVTFDVSANTSTANCDGGTETSAVGEQTSVDLVDNFYIYDASNGGGKWDDIRAVGGGAAPASAPNLPMPLWMRILQGITSLVPLAHAEQWNDAKDAFIGELQGRIKFEKEQGISQKASQLKDIYGQATATPNKDFDAKKESDLRALLPDDLAYQNSKTATSTFGGISKQAIVPGGILGVIIMILTWLGFKKKND